MIFSKNALFKRNKYKFVQKVAKEMILLIAFVFSASIIFVHKTGLRKVKCGKIGSKRVKQGLTRLKLCQTALNMDKQGQVYSSKQAENGFKLGFGWV